MFSTVQLGIFAAMALGAIGVIVAAYFKGKGAQEAERVEDEALEAQRLERAAMSARPDDLSVRDRMSEGTF